MKIAAPFMDCVPVRSRHDVTDTFKTRRPNDRLLAHPGAHSCHRQRVLLSRSFISISVSAQNWPRFLLLAFQGVALF